MSRALRDFQIRGVADAFKDDLNDSSIESGWTQDLHGSDSITENDFYLEIVDTSGVTKSWSPDFNSPNLYRTIKSEDFTALVYVSNIVGVEENWAGMVHYYGLDETKYHEIMLKFVLGGVLRVVCQGMPYTFVGSWIGMVRRGEYIHYCSSANSIDNEPTFEDMTIHRSLAISADFYSYGRICLFSGKWGNCPNTNHRFYKFRIRYP